MLTPTTIVLDESCAQLEADINPWAPTLIFRRTQGFLAKADLAARELHDLLRQRALLQHAIYVAPSFAAFTGLLVADRHPGALAGLLLVEPSHPRQGTEALRILANAPTGPETERLRHFLAGFGPAWDGSCGNVSTISHLGDLPLHVLAGGLFDLPFKLPLEFQQRLVANRQALLQEYCQLSSRASFEIIAAAGHAICQQMPDVVIAAIRQMRGMTSSSD